MERATTDRVSPSGAASPLSPSPRLSSADETRYARVREDCLRSLAKRYCAIFFAAALPSFLLLVASEGEAIPVVAPGFIVVTGLLAAFVSERSEPGRRLKELDRFMKGEAPAPTVPEMDPRGTRRDDRTAHPESGIQEAAEAAPAPPFPLRAIYFFVIGIWLSCIWVHLAWLLNFTVVGITAGRAMFEQLPVVMSLSPVRPLKPLPPLRARVPLPIAALYFLGVGSWLSLCTAEIGWLLALFPPSRCAGLVCLRAVPYVLTLQSR